MNRRFAFILGAVAAVAVAAPAAQAAPRKETVTRTARAAWRGPVASALNPTWFTDSLRHTGQCGSDPQTYCDDTLVRYKTNSTAPAALIFRIDGFQPVSDFDLRVYLSDAAG